MSRDTILLSLVWVSRGTMNVLTTLIAVNPRSPRPASAAIQRITDGPSAGWHGAGWHGAGWHGAGQRSAGQRSAGQRSAGQRSAGQRSAGQVPLSPPVPSVSVPGSVGLLPLLGFGRAGVPPLPFEPFEPFEPSETGSVLDSVPPVW